MINKKIKFHISKKIFIRLICRFDPGVSHPLLLSIWLIGIFSSVALSILLKGNHNSLLIYIAPLISAPLVFTNYLMSCTIDKVTKMCPLNIIHHNYDQKDDVILALWEKKYKELSVWAWCHFKKSIYLGYLIGILSIGNIVGILMII